MGLGGISIWQLLIILVIVLVLFGTKKLRNIGSDLGGAIKNFKKSMNEGEDEDEDETEESVPEAGASIEHKSEARKERQSSAGSGNGAAKQKQS